MRCVVTSLVLASALAVPCAADPPALRPGPTPVLPDPGSYYPVILESARGTQAHIEWMIALEEKLLTEFQGAFTPEQTARFRRDLERHRADLEKQQKLVLALERYGRERESNADEAMARLRKVIDELERPPVTVAPMPREKK